MDAGPAWMNARLGWPRQEQKLRESGSASTSYQDNPTRWVSSFIIFGLIVMRLYEPKPNTMQVWVKGWGILHVGICFQEGDGDKATKIFQVVVEQPQNTTSEGCCKTQPSNIHWIALSHLACLSAMDDTSLTLHNLTFIPYIFWKPITWTIII